MSLSLSADRLRAILVSWPLPVPITISELGEGFSGETWLIEAGAERYAAKIFYGAQRDFDIGLQMAEIVERHGIPSGAPLRTSNGERSVMVDHPPGHRHPLALLRFVPGQPLDPATPGAQQLIGSTLGRIHRILQREGTGIDAGDHLFAYLTDEDPELSRHYPWLRPLLSRAVAEVETFETATAVTYGCIIGDVLQLLRDEPSGQIGIIDWGAATRGPFVFDLALAVDQCRRAGERDTTALIAHYRATGPVSTEELAGLDRYLVLLWARQARFWAWRLVHDVTRGDPHSAEGAQTLEHYRQQIERSWANID